MHARMLHAWPPACSMLHACPAHMLLACPHAACMPASMHNGGAHACMCPQHACAHVPARAWRIKAFPTMQCAWRVGVGGAGPKHKALLVFVLRSSTARHLSAKLPLGAELPGSCCVRASVRLTGPARHNRCVRYNPTIIVGAGTAPKARSKPHRRFSRKQSIQPHRGCSRASPTTRREGCRSF